MDASAFFSSSPQYTTNNNSADDEFETLDINGDEPSPSLPPKTMAIAAAADSSQFFNRSAPQHTLQTQSNNAASDFFGGRQTSENVHVPQQQFRHASSGPENFSMPNFFSNQQQHLSHYTNNSNFGNEPNDGGGGVALQAAFSTFSAAASSLASKTIAAAAGGGGADANNSRLGYMGSRMIKGLGNLASNIVSGDDEIAEAMQAWAVQQQHQQQQQEKEKIREGKQLHNHHQQQYQQPYAHQQQHQQQQLGYLMRVSSDASSAASAADFFGGGTTTASAAITSTAAASATAGAIEENASFGANIIFGAASKSSAENLFGKTVDVVATNGRNASADDFFGKTVDAVATDVVNSSADVSFGKTVHVAGGDIAWTANYDENASVANVFGVTTDHTSAEEVFRGVDTTTMLEESHNTGMAPTENTDSVNKPPQQQRLVNQRQLSHQLSSLECAEHDPTFQYSDPLIGTAIAPSTATTTATNNNDCNHYGFGIAKPPLTGNVIAMEIGKYHPPTAQQQGMDISLGVDDFASASENAVEPNETVVEIAPQVAASVANTVDTVTATLDTIGELFGGTSAQQHQTPPLAAASPNALTIKSSPIESTEKHTIISTSLAPETRPTATTTSTHCRFQLNLPKKVNLPLPPPRSSLGGGGGGSSLGGSTGRKKKLLGSSPFRKPPPMEVSATPRFHVPPAAGSSVGSGGSGSHSNYHLPRTTTPGAASVLTTSPLPTPRVLADDDNDDDNDDNVPSSSPLLPAALTATTTGEAKVPSAPTNSSPGAPVVSKEGGNVTLFEKTNVADISTTEETTRVTFQPLELEKIVEAVAAAPDEFKMELPRKEDVNYRESEDVVENAASTMAGGLMQDAVLSVASPAINGAFPFPYYSLTTRPIYHEGEIPRAESSLFTEGGASDYQSNLVDEDLPPLTEFKEEFAEMFPSAEKKFVGSLQSESKIPTTFDENAAREDSVRAVVSSSVVTEYAMSDYQEQVTEEDFAVVDRIDIDNNDLPSNDAALSSSSPWVDETVDPVNQGELQSMGPLRAGWIEARDPSGKVFYFNPITGESSWERPENVVPGSTTALADGAAIRDEYEHPIDSGEGEVINDLLETQDTAPVEIENLALAMESSPVEDDAENLSFESLPSGWIEAKDTASGQIYYYNEENGESSWSRPTATEATDDVAAINDVSNLVSKVKDDLIQSQVCVQDAIEEPQVETINDETNIASEEQKPVNDLLLRELGSELPVGWFEATYEGRPYYYNEETGETSWSRPIAEAVDDQDESGRDVEQEDTALFVAEDVLLTSTPQVLEGGEVLETNDADVCDEEEEPTNSNLDEAEEPTAVEEATEQNNSEDMISSEELPAGWMSSVDETTNRTFYYNVSSGGSTWDKPLADVTDIVSTGEELVEGTAVDEAEGTEIKEVITDSDDQQPRVDEVADDSAPVETVELSPGGNLSVDVTTEKKFDLRDGEQNREVGSGDANGGETYVDSLPNEEPHSDGLPNGWRELQDEATGETYYWNEVTNETSWDYPQEGPVSDELDNVQTEGEENRNNHVEADVHVPDVDPSPKEEFCNVDVKEEPHSDGLPDGWRELQDEATGETYYWNEVTNETSWDYPQEGPVPVSDELDNVQTEGEENKNDHVEADVHVPDVDPSPKEEFCNVDVKEEPHSDGLPDGWRELQDEATGETYYWNEVTNETSWDYPQEGPVPVSDELDNMQTEGEENKNDHVEADVHVPDVDPSPKEEFCNVDVKEEPHSDGLPDGWRELQDEATGETYYWNEVTNETSWDYPQEGPVPVSDELDNMQTEGEENKNDHVEADVHVPDVDPSPKEEFCNVDVKEEPHSDGLPDGWRELQDEATGETYYWNEVTNETSWDRPVTEIPNRSGNRCRPAHAIATFGFGGRLCVMMPQLATSLSGKISPPSSSDRPTMRRGPVVIHRVKDLLPCDNKFSIPSSKCSVTVTPLVKAKEKDVMSFLRQKSESAENLIWSVINIAAQNRGRLKNSDDVIDEGPEAAIVELLLSVEKNGKSSYPNVPSVQSADIDLNEVQEFLIRGDRESAVAEALRKKNYALALIIAGVCDETTYQMAARQFVDDALSLCGDARHESSFWCRDSYKGLETNWKQHLAAILNNKREHSLKIILMLGDRLMQLGQCHAAHVCYLAASSPLSNPSKPSTRIALLGCDHNIAMNRALMTPEAVKAFERSEAYEWARRLGNKKTSFSSLQPFKLRYAELLADHGHELLAREYLLSIRICTGIGIITRGKGNPASSFNSSFIQSLRELDDRICGSTGVERSSWNANEESSKGSLFSLGRLSALVRGKEAEEQGTLTPRPENEVDPLLELNTDILPPAKQSQKIEQMMAVVKTGEQPNKPQLQIDAFEAPIGISNVSKQESSIDDATPASAPASLAIGDGTIDQAEDSNFHEQKMPEKSTLAEVVKKDEKKKAPASEPPVSAGLLARLFGRDKDSKVKVADVGEDMKAYYDEKLKRWIFPGDDPVEVAKPLAPPPIMKPSDKAPSTPALAPSEPNDPLASLMAPPSRATSRKGLPPTMARYADPLASMGNMSTPGTSLKKDAAPPKFAVFQPIPTKTEPSKDEKENVAAS